MKIRLDQQLVKLGLVATRSQAENYVKLGQVKVNDRKATKAGLLVGPEDKLQLTAEERYVSRAALKLASVAEKLGLDFQGKTVLDVGSSTGGFTDYALRHGARLVIAVEVGRDQMHASLRSDPRVELHERTDIRQVHSLSRQPDIVLADVSFISLREILPHVAALGGPRTVIAAMVKPQFEAASTNLKHKGVIKNDRIRRDIIKDFENWAHAGFVVLAKADSEIKGAKGNQERFYLLRKA